MDRFVRDVNDADKAAILTFSQQHPWKPSYPTSLVNRFLTELISSNELIFDLHDAQGRVACGVLIDKRENGFLFELRRSGREGHQYLKKY